MFSALRNNIIKHIPATLTLPQAFILWLWWSACLGASTLAAAPHFLSKVGHIGIWMFGLLWMGRQDASSKILASFKEINTHVLSLLSAFLIGDICLFSLGVFLLYVLVRYTAHKGNLVLGKSFLLSALMTPFLVFISVLATSIFGPYVSAMDVLSGPIAYFYLSPLMAALIFLLCLLFLKESTKNKQYCQNDKYQPYKGHCIRKIRKIAKWITIFWSWTKYRNQHKHNSK